MLVATVILSVLILVLFYLIWSQNRKMKKSIMYLVDINDSFEKLFASDRESISNIREDILNSAKSQINMLGQIKEIKQEVTAIGMLAAGVKPSWSWGINEKRTAGFGELDSNGFWEIPLPEYIIKILYINREENYYNRTE